MSGHRFDSWIKSNGHPERMPYEPGNVYCRRVGVKPPAFRMPHESNAERTLRMQQQAREQDVAALESDPATADREWAELHSEEDEQLVPQPERPSYLHTPSREEILADMVGEHPGHKPAPTEPLETAVVTEVIDGRRGVYGEPRETFPQIAKVWSGIIGHEIAATDVPLMLIGMKLVRTHQAPDFSDNSDDVEGYLKIFRELVGDDMVHARTVADYLKEKSWLGKSW